MVNNKTVLTVAPFQMVTTVFPLNDQLVFYELKVDLYIH